METGYMIIRSVKQSEDFGYMTPEGNVVYTDKEQAQEQVDWYNKEQALDKLSLNIGIEKDKFSLFEVKIAN